MSTTRFDIGEIFRMFGQEYESKRGMTSGQRRVLRAVASCRTEALGGHVDRCGSCGRAEVSYNSCRDRHCPKCQGAQSRKWVDARKAELLPVPYFHLVFTIPASLAVLVQSDARRLYGLLFEAMSESLLPLFRQRHKAVPSVVSVLHTWGSDLSLHPHLHCVVSGGGLSLDGRSWIPTGGDYLLDVKELSARFKSEFLKRLAKAFPGFAVPPEASGPDWVVFCQKPFAGPEAFVEYIGRYTHRAAVSNGRILDFDPAARTVTLDCKDYRAAGPDGAAPRRPVVLDVLEFIRRFLSHVLPGGFRKIRFHGLGAGKNRAANLAKSRALHGLPSEAAEPAAPGKARCPACGGTMEKAAELPPDKGKTPIVFRNERKRTAA